MNPEPNQVWRDTVNQDLLLVRQVDPEPEPNRIEDEILVDPPKRYARCFAFCKPGSFIDRPGIQYMGIQEMQFKHFDGPRFVRLGFWKTLYYRFRMKGWVKKGGPA